MKPSEHEVWRERFWRRKLTTEQLAELRAAHPDAMEAPLEAALSEALGRLPDAPVPSNFTACVVREVERQATMPARTARDWAWIFRVLVPRTAVALLLVGVGVFALREHQAKQRVVIANSIKAVAAVPALPSPQALEDFDVIEKLNASPAADRDLLALLQ